MRLPVQSPLLLSVLKLKPAGLRLAEGGGTRPGAPIGPPTRSRTAYLRGLTWAFTFFNSVRVLCYLPTLWAILQSGDSSQHSLWTWGTWFSGNLTMSLWLIERNDGRMDRAALVSAMNAAMCFAVIAVIIFQRL